MKSFYRGHHWNLDTDFMPERAGFTRPCCFHLGYPGLWWPNPNSIQSLVSRIRMNCGSVWQMISGESEIAVGFNQEMNCTLRWDFIILWIIYIYIKKDLPGIQNKGFSYCTCCQGPLFMEGGAMKGGISQHRIQPIPLTHTHLRPRIPVHTLTVCMYSTSSMLILTQVWTNFIVCCAFLMVPSRSCVNILFNCQEMCQEWKEAKAILPRTPLLHFYISQALPATHVYFLKGNYKGKYK